MLPNLKGYFRPKSVSEALALLEKNSGTILIIAGGTKLVKSDNETVQELVDITSLDLDYVKEDAGVIRIGATTCLQNLAENPMLRDLANGILCKAAMLTNHSKMIRNVSTLGGELICTGPFSVLYCALLVLQGQVRIVGGEEFALAMNIFLNKKKIGGGILMEVLIPALLPDTYAGMSFITGTTTDNPIICGCARITLSNKKCLSAKLAITGTANVPQRLHEIESLLENEEFTRSNIQIASEKVYDSYDPITDKCASTEYRKEVGSLVIKRALTQCLKYAENEL